MGRIVVQDPGRDAADVAKALSADVHVTHAARGNSQGFEAAELTEGRLFLRGAPEIYGGILRFARTVLPEAGAHCPPGRNIRSLRGQKIRDGRRDDLGRGFEIREREILVRAVSICLQE
jgi:hypothetical protein